MKNVGEKLTDEEVETDVDDAHRADRRCDSLA